jgi:hypothetical protein
MLTEKLGSECHKFSNPIETPANHQAPLWHQPEIELQENGKLSRPLFEQILPASLAEQFPRLVFLSVAFSILLAVITAEIDCLRGAGYYWP